MVGVLDVLIALHSVCIEGVIEYKYFGGGMANGGLFICESAFCFVLLLILLGVLKIPRV